MNFNPYLNMSVEDLEKTIISAEKILNHDYHLIGEPLYNFYIMKKTGEKNGIPEHEIISKAQKAHAQWNAILDLWIDDYELIDACIKYFNYEETCLIAKKKTNQLSKSLEFTDEEIQKLTKDEVDLLLCPPSYQPSENEILLRRYYYAFDEFLFDRLSSLASFYSYTVRTEAGENVTENDTDAIFSYNIENSSKYYKEELEVKNKGLRKVLDEMITESGFSGYVHGLSDSHSGDCTACPCACMRCHAEEMFNVSYTANWSKSVGYKLESWRLKFFKN